MKSATLPSFWENYNSLDIRVKEQARKAYRFWLENPFHRSLYFKCINQEDNIWSVRITRSYRAVGILLEFRLNKDENGGLRRTRATAPGENEGEK